MRVLNLVQGAWPRHSGIGFPSVFEIGSALCRNGHAVEIQVAGPPSPADGLGEPTSATKLGERRWEIGDLLYRSFPAYGKSGIAPLMLTATSRSAMDADLIVLHSIYSFPVVAGYGAALLQRRPYAVWLHGVLAPFQRSVSAGKKALFDRWVGDSLLRGAHRVIVTAPGERDELPDRGMGLPAKTAVVPLGVDTESYAALPRRGAFRKKYLSGHSGRVVLFLGRLNSKKALDLAIASLPRIVDAHPDVLFAFVGPADPPPYADYLATQAKRLGVERSLVLTGAITDSDEKRAVLADSDVYVSMSHAENFCHSMFECMAGGVPIIISDRMNYAELVRERGAGVVIEQSAEQLKAALDRVFESDDETAAMRRRAKQMAEEHTWDATARLFEERVLLTLSGRGHEAAAHVGPAVIGG